MIRFFQEQQTTGSTVAPTGPTDSNGAPIGLPLADAGGYRLTIAAASGQTLTGTGTMRCVMYHPGLALWCRNADLDFPVSEDTAGVRAVTFSEVECVVGDAVQVYYYPDAVGTSAGGVTMRLDRSVLR